MGCLVSKCSMTNLALQEGSTVYINLIVNSLPNSEFNSEYIVDGHAVQQSSAYVQGTSGIEYYRPIGIILKATYDGWSSFTLDASDDLTKRNLIRLVNNTCDVSVKDRYDINFTSVITADDLFNMIEAKQYQEVWELINERLSSLSYSNLYIKNSYQKPEKVFLNVISGEAYDYIMDEKFQRNLFKSRGISGEEITINEYVDSIKDNIQSITNFENEMNYRKANGISKHSISRCLFEEGNNFKLRGFGRVSMNYDIYSHELDNLNNLDNYIEAFIKDFIYASYISNCFLYMDIPVFPLTKVNEEEYHSDSVIIGLQMIKACANKMHSNYIDDVGFDSITKMSSKDSDIYVTYFNKHNEECNEISRNEFLRMFPTCKFIEPHKDLDTRENLLYVYKEMYNHVEILAESDITHFSCYKPMVI